MTTITVDALIKLDRNGTVCVLTEHNRSPVDASPERIESSDRMANGTLRRYYVSDKRTWSVSWDMLPAPTSETVDGKAGADEIEKFYYATKGAVDLTVQHADTNLDYTVKVMLTSFEKTHARRGEYDFWDISLTMEEV